jgi:hypothetical protein
MTTPLAAYLGAKVHIMLSHSDGPIHESFLTGFVELHNNVPTVRTSRGNFTQAQILEIW